MIKRDSTVAIIQTGYRKRFNDICIGLFFEAVFGISTFLRRGYGNYIIYGDGNLETFNTVMSNMANTSILQRYYGISHISVLWR